MKKYIFFTCSVFGVGGGQLYVANKADYLMNRGYKVYTVSSSIYSPRGTVFYTHLNQTENFVFTELRHVPGVYSLKRQERIVEKFIRTIGIDESDEIVLESNYLTGGIWAEKIAEQTRCKHIVFSVSEHNEVDQYMCDFLDFKFQRGELATISKKSFAPIIDRSSLITEQNLPLLRAYLGDNVDDVNNERLDEIEKGDFSICIMGRGEKRYVEYACQSVLAFCQKHPTIVFSVALISQFHDSKKEKEITDAFCTVKNIKFYYLGYLAPVPRKLLTLFDLYIGGAGCASLFYRQNVLTLAMDLYNDRPLGFMGYDTCVTNTVSSKESSMDECLEDAFFKKEYLKKEYKPAVYVTADEAFSYHDSFLESGSKEKEYFTVVNKKVSLKEKVKAHFPFLVEMKSRLLKAIGKL